MSAEFGNGDRFFHQLINEALSTAKEGRTHGARVMAALLDPISEMSYAVSLEEAGDSGEDATVTCFALNNSRLKTAMDALTEYLQPSVNYAALAFATYMQGTVTIESKTESSISFKVPFRIERQNEHWGVFQKALETLAEKHGIHGHWAGCSYQSNDDHAIHTIAAYGSKDHTVFLKREIIRLEQELAAAKLEHK